MSTGRVVARARVRSSRLLLVAAAVVAAFAIVVTSSGLGAASNPIAVEYSHDLVIQESHSDDYVWDPGVADAGSIWSFESSEPVPYEVGIQSSFDPHSTSAEPYSSYQWEDLNKFAFHADSYFTGQAVEPIPVDSGLILERRVQPDVLMPGHNSVSISAGIFVSNEATVDGMTVDRTGGELWLKAHGSGAPFEAGALIGFEDEDIVPLEVVSSEGEPVIDLAQSFDPGAVHNIWVDAEIYNPNDFAVRYFPGFEAKIQVDSSPLGYLAPSGVERDMPYLGIETWSYGERAFFVLDSLDGSARDWEYDYSTRGLWHVFMESLEAAPGESASFDHLILPVDDEIVEIVEPVSDLLDSGLGELFDDANSNEVDQELDPGVEIRVDSEQGFLGYANPALDNGDGVVASPDGPVASSFTTFDTEDSTGDASDSVTPPDESFAPSALSGDVGDSSVTPPEEPEQQRGFFVNPAPGEGVDIPIKDLADPAVLSVIGILVTLFAATVQLARGQ